MEKEKLIAVRKQKGFSQQTMANHLCIDVSNYNRREKGNAKISYEESVEDIYQPDEGYFIICKDQSVGINNGTNNVYTVPEHLLETQRKYFEKLEKELEELKKK